MVPSLRAPRKCNAPSSRGTASDAIRTRAEEKGRAPSLQEPNGRPDRDLGAQLPVWRNGIRRGLKILRPPKACGFESRLRHQAILLAFLLLSPALAHAEVVSQFFSVARSSTGAALPSATVGIYLAGTSTTAPIFSDPAGTTPKSNPFLTDAQGNFSFFSAPGLYKVVVTKVGTGTFTTDQVPVGTQLHAARHTSGPDTIFLQSLPGLLLPGQVTPGSLTSTQLSPTAGILESQTAFSFPSHSNANDPSSGQKSALVGTYGLPGSSNRFVTTQDPRLSDARTTLSHGATHGAAGSDPVTIAPSQISASIVGSTAATGLATTTHHAAHQLGGGDQVDVTGLSGVLASPQTVAAQANGSSVATRSALDFVDGTNTTVTLTDDPGSGRVTVRVDSPQTQTVSLLSGSTTVANPVASLSFDPGQFSVTQSPTGAGHVSVSTGGVAAGGDVSGFLASLTVSKLQGRTLASTAPSTGDRIAWSGSQWAPTPNPSFVVQQAGANVSTNPSSLNFQSGFGVSTSGSQANVVLDLSTQVINAVKLQGIPVLSTPPNDQQVLRYVLADAAWEPSTLTPNPSFRTISAPGGSNPVATIVGDTLTLLATAPMTLTGSSGAKSVTVAVSDATTSTKGVVELAGDLAGTAASPSVVSLRGTAVSPTGPTIGQVLKYDGSTWAPGTDNTGGGGVNLVTAGNGVTVVSNTTTLNFATGLDVTQSPTGQGNIAINLGALANVSATQLKGSPLCSSFSPTTNQLLQYTGTCWGPAMPAATGVTSVSLTTPGTLFTVSGSPVTGSGTITLSAVSQTANTVFSGPTSGGAAAGTFRALVAADLPVVALGSKTTGNYVASLATGSGLTGGASGSAGAPLTLSAVDAGASTKGVVELNTDLGGTAASPTVVGFQGRPVSSTAPATGNTWIWGGTSWTPGTPVTNLSSVTGTLAAGNVAQNLTITSAGAVDAGAVKSGTLANARLGTARTQFKTFTILYPNDSAGNDVGYVYFPYAATLTQVAARVRGSSGACDSNVKDNGSTVLSSNLSATLAGAATTTISSPNVTAGDWVSFYVGGCTGSTTELSVTLVYSPN